MVVELFADESIPQQSYKFKIEYFVFSTKLMLSIHSFYELDRNFFKLKPVIARTML